MYLSTTSDFLIFGKISTILNENEKLLITSFRSLSDLDKIKELTRLQTLAEVENLAKTKEIKLSDIEKNA